MLRIVLKHKRPSMQETTIYQSNVDSLDRMKKFAVNINKQTGSAIAIKNAGQYCFFSICESGSVYIDLK